MPFRGSRTSHGPRPVAGQTLSRTRIPRGYLGHADLSSEHDDDFDAYWVIPLLLATILLFWTWAITLSDFDRAMHASADASATSSAEVAR